MILGALAISISDEDIRNLLSAAVARSAAMAEGGATAAQAKEVADSLKDLKVAIKKERLEITMKQKMGPVPLKLTASLELGTLADGEGVTITLAKVSAGFIGSEAVAGMIMGQVRQAVENAGIPGISVTGSTFTISKAALARFKGVFDVTGKVKKFAVEGNQLILEIG